MKGGTRVKEGIAGEEREMEKKCNPVTIVDMVDMLLLTIVFFQ